MEEVILTKSAGEIRKKLVEEKYVDKITEPYAYMKDLSAGHFRSTLGQILNHWYKIPTEKLKIISEIVEECHNASLLLDDIQDESLMRRGSLAAHLIYGIPLTIAASTLISYDIVEKVRKMDHPDALKIFLNVAMDCLRGQEMEIVWRSSNKCPTEEEYCHMCALKTGSIFKLAAQLIQLSSETDYDLSNAMYNLGILFQVLNDFKYLDNSAGIPSDKECFDEITEGKFTFPFIHAVQKNPNDKRLTAILKKRTDNIELKKYCVALLEDYGSLDYTREKISQLKRDIKKELNNLGENPELNKLFAVLERQQVQ